MEIADFMFEKISITIYDLITAGHYPPHIEITNEDNYLTRCIMKCQTILVVLVAIICSEGLSTYKCSFGVARFNIAIFVRVIK